jgi:hypothetical protein
MKRNFALITFPPYSPDLNPIERVWKLTRKLCIHDQYFPTIEAVATAVETQFRENVYVNRYTIIDSSDHLEIGRLSAQALLIAATTPTPHTGRKDYFLQRLSRWRLPLPHLTQLHDAGGEDQTR